MSEVDWLALALARPDPFGDPVVPNAFVDPAEDVEEIHLDARQALMRLVDEVRENGRPRLQLVLGDAGLGKTHLLARLRRDAARSWGKRAQEFALVPILPLADPEAPFAHLLRETVSGLRRRLQSAAADDVLASPFDHLVWHGFREATASLRRARPDNAALAELDAFDIPGMPSVFATQAKAEWSRLGPRLRDEAAQFPPVDALDLETWSVVTRYPEAEVSTLVVRWLRGDALAEEDLRRLGVGRPIDSEERARRALVTLLSLAAVPVVLGLDQLEGVSRHGPEAVPALFRALSELYTAGGRWLCAVFCQTQEWGLLEERGVVERQVRSRFEPRPIVLRPLTPELGERLVARRLAGIWRHYGLVPPHPTAPYPDGFVKRELEKSGVFGPRDVIEHFRRLGLAPSAGAPARGTPTPEPLARARRELTRRRRERAQTGPEAVGDELVQHALVDLLRRAGRDLPSPVTDVVEHKVQPMRRAGFRAKVGAGAKARSCYGEVWNGEHAAAAKLLVGRLGEALRQGADGAVWCRDPNKKLPPAAKRELEGLGGRAKVVPLSPDDVLSLAAMNDLLNALAAGDAPVSDTEASALAAELLPSLDVVRALGAAPAPAGDASAARVEEALARPPFVATQAQLARALGVSAGDLSGAINRLEADGQATVVVAADGTRVVAGKP